MLIPFTKMHAQGNDFIFLNHSGQTDEPPGMAELAKCICDRRFGVGADGLVILLDDTAADGRMLIFNSDGSRAAMCGSALRCTAFLLHTELGLNEMRISTDSGIKPAWYHQDSGVEVDLGVAALAAAEMTVMDIPGSLIDIGNLHFVCFAADLDNAPHLQYGPALETHTAFPHRVNIEFARVHSHSSIEIVIWERGCGATFACGTGAAATVFAGMQQGILTHEVVVKMPGGAVKVIARQDGHMHLQGAVTEVFNGVYKWKT